MVSNSNFLSPVFAARCGSSPFACFQILGFFFLNQRKKNPASRNDFLKNYTSNCIDINLTFSVLFTRGEEDMTNDSNAVLLSVKNKFSHLRGISLFKKMLTNNKHTRE